jgi:asparagine synthase (glutamine-hydrolysing)
MSGVFGFVDPRHYLSDFPLLDKIGNSLLHHHWYVCDSYYDADHCIGLGRIGIGIFNKETQPVWNDAGDTALVWAGEIYNINNGNVAIEKVLLQRYAEEGENFVRQLNGAFILCIWDQADRKLHIMNDRFGMYNLFYAVHSGRLVFAPEVKGVLCDPGIPRRLDLTATAQYIRLQRILGDRTYFEDIKRLPGASILTFDLLSEQLSICKYWTYNEIPHRPEINFMEAVVETGRLLRKAVTRLSGDEYQAGVFLSGGLDSRILLGMINRPKTVSLTFGHANSRDVYYGKKIAKATNSEHHWFDLPDGKWVRDHLDQHFALTEGFHHWVHMHGITMLPKARELIDVNLTGWDGGELLGHPLMLVPGLYNPVDDHALAQAMFKLFAIDATWPGMTESEERELYQPDVWREVQGRAFDSFKEELRNYLDFRRDVRSEFFFYDQHCMRSTHNMVVCGRSHVEFRYPYYDYELFDFIYSLPVHHRSDRKLTYALLRRELPHLARIPYEHDELLPTDQQLERKLHGASVKVKGMINRHVFPIFPERQTLYADYENYLRHDLREWAEALLFDGRTVNRGIFDPAFVKSLWNRHLSGYEIWTIGKIAPIMSYEMVLRAFFDGPVSQTAYTQESSLVTA